ncbi:hypothetical protein ACHAXR_005348 [Thalassiosira sp. AJA248-18]
MPPLHEEDSEANIVDDQTPQSPPPTEDDVKNSPLVTLAGMAGNVLEWYDFALFGFFSDIIAEVFFPPSDDEDNNNDFNGTDLSHGNLVRSFAVYGGAFVMRPIGGILIGYCGDKYGRKQALVPALFLMAIPTTLMGCLPTYEQVGGWSTALLVMCRLVQGMSVGGQLPASLIYTVETRPKEQWGFYGSLVMMCANIGTLLGNLIGALMRTVLTHDQLVSWGWRIPFLTGSLNAFVALYLWMYGYEHHPNAGEYDTVEGDDDQDSNQKESEGQVRPRYPLREVCRRENLPGLLSAWLTTSLYGGAFYTSFVWMATYMDVLIDPPIENAFWVNAMALLFGIVLVLPVTGMLSDHTGRLKAMIAGAVGLAILGPIMLWVISTGGSVKAFFAQWTIGLFLSLFGGPMNAWLVEMFPAKFRLTSAALGYDLAHCTASAFSPLVATVLVNEYGPLAPGAMYPFFAVLSLIGMFISTRTRYDIGDTNDMGTLTDGGSNTEPLL